MTDNLDRLVDALKRDRFENVLSRMDPMRCGKYLFARHRLSDGTLTKWIMNVDQHELVIKTGWTVDEFTEEYNKRNK